MGGSIQKVLVEFHPTGSLATTHETQGSDMGLFGGLMGWEAADHRLVDSREALRQAGIDVRIEITDFPAFHPNTYRLTLRGGPSPADRKAWAPAGTAGGPEGGQERAPDGQVQHRMTALSTGGGIIRVVEIDGIPVSISGDLFETLVFLPAGAEREVLEKAEGTERDRAPEEPAEETEGPGTGEGPEGRTDASGDCGPLETLREDLGAEGVVLHRGQEGSILRISTRMRPSANQLRTRIVAMALPFDEVRTLAPVLPVLSQRGVEVPFLNARDMERHWQKVAGGTGPVPSLWEMAVQYESARGGIREEEVLNRMKEIVEIMERSVAEGLAGTDYHDRILPPQTGLFRTALETGNLLDAGMLNRMVLYVSAIMEVKSSMGVVVAAPTAGSCGALPAAVLAAGHTLGATTDDVARAMLAAGIVGVFITQRSTFAAEECGCQAECGAGSGMAAAALVTLAGGSADQALAAASMALQNTLGMVCDPVANRVEVPCLGRNVLAAGNGLTSANLALAGFDPVIPLDEVIDTMDRVGKALPRELRCTALGGLSVTETSQMIQIRLDRKRRIV